MTPISTCLASISAPLSFRSSLSSCMNTTRSRESRPASTRLYDSRPVRLYLAFNSAKVECMSESHEQFPVSFSREKSERTVNLPSKQMWLEGKFTVLSDFSREKDTGNCSCDSDMHSTFAELKARYNLTGRESYNLVEAGLDSLDLVVFMHELKELLKDKGAEMLARQVDIGVIQRVAVAELFGLAEKLKRAPEEALVHLRHSLAVFREEQRAAEKQLMNSDRKLIFEPPVPLPVPEIPVPSQVLLTGGTGFIG